MRIKFFGLNMDIVDYKEVIFSCERFIADSKCNVISFVNLHAMNFSKKYEEFKKAINGCDLVLNDGVGVEILCRLNKTPVVQNMNGTDLIPDIAKWAANNGHAVFLLGSKDNIVKSAVEKLEQSHPDIRVSGYHDGYFDKENSDSVIELINKSGAEVLIIGMGMPLQEVWIDKNKEKLTNVKIAICGGAILDYISGIVKRSPNWIVKIRMEWLFRMAREPKRLIMRNITGLWRLFISFLIIVKKNLKQIKNNYPN